MLAFHRRLSRPTDSTPQVPNRNSSFVLDGEGVLLGVDGISDFNGLHLVSDGEDVRKLSLSMRKTNLARLLARRADGPPAPFEQGEMGPDLFRHACMMGLEGLVSKHRDRPYRAGRTPDWVKVKNRKHPAMSRVMARLRPDHRLRHQLHRTRSKLVGVPDFLFLMYVWEHTTSFECWSLCFRIPIIGVGRSMSDAKDRIL